MEDVIAYIVSLFWPLDASVQNWMAVLVGGMTLYFISFGFQSRDAEKRLAAKKLKRSSDLLAIMRADLEAKEAEQQDSPLPEANRVFELLFDNVAEERFAVSSDQRAYFERVLRRASEKELRETVRKTTAARDACAESVGKEEGEFVSGEKLKEKLELLKKLQKHIGAHVVDAGAIKEAERLLSAVRREQTRRGVLLDLLRPALPALAIAMPANVFAQGLQSVYYQIGRWNYIGEAAAAGDVAASLYWTLELGAGHLLVWFFEALTQCYTSRAQGVFAYQLRGSVMRSLVQQDYEYFDKNPAGVLQERLNRDADILGSNLIQLPQEFFGQIAKASIALVQVYLVVPRWLFVTAVAPLPVIVALGFVLEKWQSRMRKRSRKLTEEAAASTGEVLKEIRTVRQFANEDAEVGRYMDTEGLKITLEERREVVSAWSGKIMGVIVVSGLMFTCYQGAKAVASGELGPGLVMDTAIKMNFFVVFPLRHAISLLPRLMQALEPLGRICELLDAVPGIESKAGADKLTVANACRLKQVLASCETVTDKRGAAQTRLSSALAGHEEIAPGSTLLEVCDAAGNMVSEKRLASPEGVAFPLALHFSRQKVPLQFEGAIEFKDVHFAYPNDLRKPVLRGLSFSVEPGQKVALVGEAGCGKSSCMGLVQRLYDPTQGMILFDGVPLPLYDIKFLRRRVVLVEQKPVLFSGTVRDNVCYGLLQDVGDDVVEQVLRDASLWEGENGIASKPDRILTKLGNGGIALSGGHTQRVAIARAMIRNPNIILLDEATSALDNMNEKVVQEALDRLARRGSALVIAHRLTTIKDSDKICVMRSGRLVEQGTHAELLTREIVRETQADGKEAVVRGIYRFLWELQFAPEAEAGTALTDMDADKGADSDADSLPRTGSTASTSH
jgi:ABC-type multidrug transport system fused ATPase/permease subunit